MKKISLGILLSAYLFAECYEVRLSGMDRHLSLSEFPECQAAEEGNGTVYSCGCYDDENWSVSEKRKLERWFSDHNASVGVKIHTPQPERSALRQDELKLMYQVFNYRSDLESAYKVAKQALKQYPNDPYWHQKAAEVCQWTGRSEEAMEHLRYVYMASPSKKLREKLIRYSMDAYQYETAMPLVKERLFESPTKKNIDTFLYIWEQAGEPEKAAAILSRLYEKDSSLKYALEQALRLYLDLGSVEEAGKIVKRMEAVSFNSSDALSLRAYYYYLKQDLDRVYEILKKGSDIHNAHYLRQLSDIGWYLGKKKEASRASAYLDAMGKATLQDYERMVAVSANNPAVAMKAALKAWHLYKKSYFFMTFVYLSIEQGEYEAVYPLLKEFEKNAKHDKHFKMDAAYYLMKAQIYLHTNHPEEAKSALLQAKKFAPGNPEIEAALLWYYMDNKYTGELREMIFEIEERGSISPRLWLPLASGHFTLQHSDRAAMYVKRLLKEHPDNTDIRFLYAYILQVQNETAAFMKQMKIIYASLEAKRQRDPSVMRDQQFLDPYLKSAMYLVNPDTFERMLLESRPYLDTIRYKQLSYLWAVRNNAAEQANMILSTMKKREPWMLLNRALYFKDISGVQELLYRYYTELPSRDRVTAARESGNLAFAYTLAFDGLEQNREDEALYRQFKLYSEMRADRFDLLGGYLGRAGALKQRHIGIKNRNYLGEGVWIELVAKNVKSTVSDRNILSDVPEHELVVGMRLKKELDRGSVSLGAGYRNAMKSYYNAEASLNWKWGDRWHIDLEGKWHGMASETIYTLLGGYKDFLSAAVSFQYLPSTQLFFSADYASFHSQDGVNLGSGEHYMLRWQYLLRQGYPDLAGGVFAEYGTYDETSGSRGVIDRMMPYTFKALPDDFANIGLSLQYGLQNENSYTRVWRPYAEFTPIYNCISHDFSFAIRGGIGGNIWNQDHLVVGFDYNQAVNGTDEKSFGLFIYYRLLY